MAKFELCGIFLVLVFVLPSARVAESCVSNVTVEGAPNLNVAEGAGYLTVTLKRTGNISQDAEVKASTADIDAKSGTDYDSLTDPAVLFAANAATASFNVTIKDDKLFEQFQETFSLRFQSDNVKVCNNTPSVTVTITDDDKVNVGFVDDSLNIKENVGNISLFFYKKRLQTEIPVTVRYFTPGTGDAVINTDYANISHTFTYQVSQYSRNFTNGLQIIDDNIAEATECFYVSLDAANPNVEFQPKLKKICILNDDKVTIEFSSTNITVAEEKKKVSVEIIKTGEASIPIKVRLNMLKRNFETADKGDDYTDQHNKIITFLQNETKKTVEFEIKDDGEAESTEVFSVFLEAVDASTTTIGTKNMAIIRIEDKADREFQATTLKQKQDDQKRRADLLLILLIVCAAIVGILVAVLIITLCLVKKWRKQNMNMH